MLTFLEEKWVKEQVMKLKKESSAASAGYDLSPCPFCGGLVEWCNCSDPICAVIICSQCGAEMQWGTEIHSMREHVSRAYNRRS